MTTTPMLWTVAQAAKELQVSEKHLYRLCREKRIPHVRVGSALRFSPTDLQAWLTDRALPAVK